MSRQGAAPLAGARWHTGWAALPLCNRPCLAHHPAHAFSLPTLRTHRRDAKALQEKAAKKAAEAAAKK